MKDQKELRIESVAFGGKGVARSEGKVFFVDDTVPGDVVAVEVYNDQTRYASARVVHWTERSSLRGPSGCSYSDRCGGCQWQEIRAENQLSWKKEFVESSMRRIGQLKDESLKDDAGVKAIDITPSLSQQDYRNRVLFRVRVSEQGVFQAGYFERGSREFVHVSRCSIADPTINRLIAEVALLDWTKLGHSNEVRFRFEVQVVPKTERILNSSDHAVLITVYEPEGDSKVKALDIVELVKGNGLVLWCGQVSDLSEAPFVFFENDLDIDFFTAPGIFQQINLANNRLLRRRVVTFANSLLSNKSRVLDLCCGSGNLSLPLAKQGYSVTGVEFSKKSIACAEHNKKQNKLVNADFFVGDAEKFVLKASKAHDPYDLVILDPPRQGMFKAMTSLVSLNPKAILYVSCDPTTLARDVGVLTKQGYRLTSLEAMDFFPNTYHVESLAVLQR